VKVVQSSLGELAGAAPARPERYSY
jgi:hypothetical protein